MEGIDLHRNVSAGTGISSDLTAESAELARVFGHVSRHPSSIEWLHVEPSLDGFPGLACAVRAFVVARRADGASPERVLVALKGVTRPSFVPGTDEARGERLQSLILREFLASYYGATTSVASAPTAIE